MHPVYFEGSVEIGKPKDMTDEQCMSAWAKFGFDKLYTKQFKWGATIPPALYAGVDNRGEPVYVKVLSKQLPLMALFTLDENNNGNF